MSQISHTCLPSKITIPSDVAICVPMKQTRGTNTCFLQRAHSLRRFSGCRTESGSRLQHRLVTRAQGYSGTDQPHVQLATAKLPKYVSRVGWVGAVPLFGLTLARRLNSPMLDRSLNVKQFQSELFQWANSITCTSGRLAREPSLFGSRLLHGSCLANVCPNCRAAFCSASSLSLLEICRKANALLTPTSTDASGEWLRGLVTDLAAR